MDLSPFVAWFFPLLGVFASTCFGVWRGKLGSRSVLAVGLLLALLLGIGLTLAQGFAYEYCMDAVHLCAVRGNANMGDWLLSILCTPVYWAAAVGGWRMAR